MEKIKWACNRMPKTEDRYTSLMDEGQVRKARAFHATMPGYAPTPLARLSRLAGHLGVRDIFVKDESFRFGLNAFKVLGGSYAISRYIAQKTGREGLDYEALLSPKLKQEFGQCTFFTATDGNHGRGVAWAANRLGQRAVVYMPKGSSRARLQNILNEGAVASIENGNYDDCVRMAAEASARTQNSVVIQDTAWEGYEEIPCWIMQGYGTMALEADLQLQLAGIEKPSHIFVQAGVGSLAAAIQGYFVNRFPDSPPRVVVLEASAADCIYQGAADGSGAYRVVEGDLETMMAGLACGSPNIIAWDILKNHSHCFLSCPDWVAAKGMRMSMAPLRGDPPILSGESGAVNLGAIAAILLDAEYRELKEAIGLNKGSTILAFSTEGDTDPDEYLRVVWDGKHPSI